MCSLTPGLLFEECQGKSLSWIIDSERSARGRLACLGTLSPEAQTQPHVVSEPDPRKIEKEGLVNGAGWKCTLQNVRNFINC